MVGTMAAETGGDLVLHREYVGEVAVVAFGPEMAASRRLDPELRRHPHAVARLALHFEPADETHAERAGRPAFTSTARPLKGEARAAGEITNNARDLDSRVIMSSAMPSAKYSCSVSPLGALPRRIGGATEPAGLDVAIWSISLRRPVPIKAAADAYQPRAKLRVERQRTIDQPNHGTDDPRRNTPARGLLLARTAGSLAVRLAKRLPRRCGGLVRWSAFGPLQPSTTQPQVADCAPRRERRSVMRIAHRSPARAVPEPRQAAFRYRPDGRARAGRDRRH